MTLNEAIKLILKEIRNAKKRKSLVHISDMVAINELLSAIEYGLNPPKK